jgi:hypothetical protein
VRNNGAEANGSCKRRQWSAALSRIWDDAAEYERLSRHAADHAARADFQPNAVLDRVSAIFRHHARTNR